MKRFVKWISPAALLGVVLVWAAYDYEVNNVLPYSPIRPHRVSRDELMHLFPGGVTPGTLGMKFSPFNVTVDDSIRLKGWFVVSRAEPTKGTIILLHGIGSCKESMLKIADTLSKLGYNCIMYDSRAHGESGGLNCTFGYYEKHDVSTYIDSAIARFKAIAPFGVYGVSLGAAVALQAMALDGRIKCGIVITPFATLREVIYDYWKHISGLPIHAIPDRALKRSEEIANFFVDSVKPEEDARRVDNPVLVIHGGRDSKISVEYGERVYKNLRSPQTKWFEVAGAGHDDIELVAGESYLATIAAFLRSNLK